ncbi:MAG: NADH-ubiquinone dehydrogenase [Mesorhizobium sp.]
MSEFETMHETLKKMVPAEMASAVNMFAHPVAGAAAASALGFGLASHAIGAWMGALTGAAEASQRLLHPALREQAAAGGAGDASSQTIAKARARAKELMERAQSEARAAAAPARAAAAVEVLPVARTRRPEAVARPDAPDDLKAISGIGPKLEKVLNGVGVWSLAQIAAWTPQEAAWVDEHCGLAGRIGRDDWTGQARALAGRVTER